MASAANDNPVDPAVLNEIRGTFYCGGLSQMINISWRDYVANCMPHRTAIPELRSTQAPSREQLPDLLTFQHEGDHHLRLSSSPIGLFLWRCMRTQTAFVGLLSRNLAECGMPPPERVPITHWAGGEAREALLHLMRAMPDAEEQLDLRLVGIEALAQFIAIHFSPRGTPWRIGDFLWAYNNAMGPVCYHHALEQPPWMTTRLPLETPLVPEHPAFFTFTEILEGCARFQEFKILHNLSLDGAVDGTDIAAWRERACWGVYKPFFDCLEKLVRFEYIDEVLVGMALAAPLDPAYHPDKALCFEGVHPTYVLANYLGGRFADIPDIPDTLLGGWPDSRPADEPTETELFGREPAALFGKRYRDRLGAGAETTIYDRIEQVFRGNIRNVADFLKRTKVDRPPAPAKPCHLTFFTDSMLSDLIIGEKHFHADPDADEDPFLEEFLPSFVLILQLASHNVAHAITQGTAAQNVFDFEDCFFNRIRLHELSAPDDPNNSIPPEVYRATIEAYIRRLRTGRGFDLRADLNALFSEGMMDLYVPNNREGRSI